MTSAQDCKDFGEFSGLCYFNLHTYLTAPRKHCEDLKKKGKCPREQL